MRLLLDAHISPALAPHLSNQFEMECLAVRDLGLAAAEDTEIFFRCRSDEMCFMTKDRDFVELVLRLGPPPQVIWCRFGNCSNAVFQSKLDSALPKALELLRAGAPIVELI